MSYRILRNEKSKSRTGEDEIFLHVEVDDGSEIYSRAEWLNKEQVAYIATDPSAIEVIAGQIADRAIKDRPAAKQREEYNRQMSLARAQREASRPPQR